MGGKTTFVLDLIRRRREIISEEMEQVIYLYTEHQSKFDEFKKENPEVEFTTDMDWIDDEIVTDEKKTLIIFDDKMIDFSGKENDEICKWFTMKCHHRNTSVILLLQNAYAANLRTVSINSMYLAYMNNPRDKTSVYSLGRQIYPGRPAFLPICYDRAVSRRPFGYLFFDFHQLTNNKYRVRSSLYPTPDCEIYVPKEE